MEKLLRQAKNILKLKNDRKLLNRLKKGALKRAKKLTWENNCSKMLSIYQETRSNYHYPSRHPSL